MQSDALCCFDSGALAGGQCACVCVCARCFFIAAGTA